MKYVYLILYILVVTVHLYSSLKKDQYGRGITKGMILLLLLGFYLESAAEPSGLLIAALLFNWLGDLLLLGKGLSWFAVGGFSFGISHILFILTYCASVVWERLPFWTVPVLAAFFSALVIYIFKKLRPHLNAGLFVPMFVYLFINGGMNCFAVFRAITNGSAGALVTMFGAVLFFISDAALFFVRFKKNSILKTHFWVMLTYSVAEFLIVYGLMLR